MKKQKASPHYYNLNNFSTEAELWYNLWMNKNIAKDVLKEMEIAALVKETQTFYPATKSALLISLAQPCTTCTIERSFSTLRRVKTWLRSTMSESRLSGLCMLSVHKQMVLEKRKKIEEEVLRRFSEDPRKLALS